MDDFLEVVLAVLFSLIFFGIPILAGLKLARIIEAKLQKIWPPKPHVPHVFRRYLPAEELVECAVPSGMAIEPGVGLGPVKFGMSPSQVQRHFGEPLDYDTWNDGDISHLLGADLVYEKLLLSFDLYDSHGPLDGSKLDNIIIRRSDTLLYGRFIQDWGVHELRDMLAQRGRIPKVGMPCYLEYREPSLTCHFDEEGRIIEVEIG